MEPDLNGLTIVEDALDEGGLALFVAYAKKFSRRSYKLICLVDEPGMERALRKHLGEDSFDSIHLDDDPLGWDNDQSKDGVLRKPENLEIAIRAKLNQQTIGERKVALAIPCLSLLWITFGHAETIRWLAKLRKTNGGEIGASTSATPLPILALISGQLLTESQSAQLKYMASMWANPIRIDGDRKPEIKLRIRVQSSQRKKDRISEKALVLDVTKSFDLMTAVKSESTALSAASSAKTESSESDPTAGLTFNLKLKDAEAAAKKNVQLPHLVVRDSMKMQIGNDMKPNPIKNSKGGQVFYTPDEADDFDDEDPDADLDI